jgi:hypothetical protein
MKEFMQWITAMGAALFLFAIMLVFLMWQANVSWHETHGPNPGTVEYRTDTGSGTMAVRDLDNADKEVQEEVAKNWGLIRGIKGIEIKGVEKDYVPKVTITKKIPWE